jgi:type-F conjugative transfer system protein TraW
MKNLWLVLVILCGNAFANDLGTFGTIYSIKERNVLDWIYHERLPELEKSGAIVRLQQQLQEKAKAKVERPKGIVLPQVTQARIRKKSLMVNIAQDLYDADHNLLVKAGTQLSPFSDLPESNKALLFIDGDDPVQIDFAVASYRKNHEVRIVLTQGKPLALAREKQIPIYFDQSQALIKHFNIEKVPSKIYRQGSLLYIEELVLMKHKRVS